MRERKRSFAKFVKLIDVTSDSSPLNDREAVARREKWEIEEVVGVPPREEPDEFAGCA
jgi:hypothetical protein